ncbi:MAG: hypothetical protein U1F41_01085 [Burkholderiales bacterium]
MRYVESHQALADTGTALRPSIRANRQQIDDRFPVLGFTVSTAGLPFYEVVLTTESRLFDPRASAARNASNFFSSRESGELIPAAHEIYTAPAQALQRLSGSRNIFYTVVAYADAKGGGAVPASDPATLAADAASVTIAAGFKGSSTASLLGVSLENLRRVSFGELAAGGPVREISADEDRAEGEDGATVNARSADAPAHQAAYDDGYDDGYGTAASLDDAGDGCEDGYGSAQGTSDSDGDDDYAAASALDESDPGGDYAEAQDSTFPEGAAAPSMLEDEDYSETTHAPDASAQAFDYSDGYDEEAGALDYGEALDAAAPEAEFTVAEKRRIIDTVARLHPGRGYDAINPDGEFAGRFKDAHGKAHPATGRYHLGLSFGFVGFSQDSGNLGRLLSMMKQRDAKAFADIFGENADALVEVTNRAGPPSRESPNGRSVRVQSVGGEDLWSPAWQQRFQRAAQHPPFIAAQNELAYTLYMEPLLPFAKWLGIDTDRGLAMLYDRAMNMGVGPTRQWVVNALREQLPLTTAQRQQALSALGHADLAAFQRAAGLPATGEFDTQAYAAVIGALRGLGARSPIPVPTPVQVQDAMLRLAKFEKRRWAPALERLRTDSAFNDVRLKV